MEAVASQRTTIAPRLAGCALTLLASVQTQAADLAPTPAQSATARLVAEVSAREHYRGRPFDARLGATVLDRFLAALDPYRDILSRVDVAGFESYRARLADAFRDGDLTAPFAIYNVYRARYDDRMQATRALLAGEWRFEADEQFELRGVEAPWADPTELEGLWRRRIGNELLALVLQGRARGEALDILRKRYEQLAARVATLESDDVFRLYVDAYARTLDPHSEYFLPHRARREPRASGPLEGIGVQLEIEREYVAIRRVFDGGAADASGRLHPGDRVTAVADGDDAPIDVVGWTLDPVVDLIRGPVGSTVRLHVLAKGADAQRSPAVVSLVRQPVRLEEQTPRKSCDEADGLRLCVITVPRFYIDYAGAGRGGTSYAGTAADVARLLNEDRDRPADGILLDLRGNGGGALLEAARLAGLFIDEGTMVQVRHAGGEVERFADPIPGVVYAGPLVVLIDRYSASATEIFAAAIQDYERGSIVGEHSYGKGTVQETFDLNQPAPAPGTFGQLVLTTAEYFRITGRSAQLEGVALDLALPAWPGTGDYGERFEASPLPPESIPATAYAPAGDAPLVDDAVRARHAERASGDPALRSVFAMAKRRPPAAPSGVSLNEEQRRRTLAQMAAEERTLAAALRAAVPAGWEAGGADASVETLWRDLVLAETQRVLADVVRASRASPQPE